MTEQSDTDRFNCGLVDEAMIERAGRALCDLENEREMVAYQDGITGARRPPEPLGYEEWREQYDEQARVALNAALYGDAFAEGRRL